MDKKLWIGFVAVIILVFAFDFVATQLVMKSELEATASLWRKPEEMKWGVMIIADIFFAFFFTLIFSKGYEGRGIIEGIRYGLYVALMMMVPAAYMSYATMPVPYSYALKWFLSGTVQYMIYGAALALVYGMKENP
jgi:hypothetical protein